MPGLFTKIPLRNKNNISRLREYKEKKKSNIDQVEDMKIWDSTQIYNSGRISGATDEGIANRARYLCTLEAR
jgi:hypothetical protein